jgi:hypothetical protein
VRQDTSRDRRATPRPGGRVPQAVYVLSVPRTHHHSPPSTATGFDSEPYPAQSVRERVSVLTALTLKQVNMWYANARTRLKRKGGELRGTEHRTSVLGNDTPAKWAESSFCVLYTIKL